MAEFRKKDSVISALESSLEQVRKTLQEAEYENVQMRYKIEGLTDDQRKLSTINTSLETKMEAERKLVRIMCHFYYKYFCFIAGLCVFL